MLWRRKKMSPVISKQVSKENCRGSPDISKQLLFFRLLVFISLVTAACICGVLSWMMLSREEHKGYLAEYDSFSSFILDTVKMTLLRSESISETLAMHVGLVHSNHSAWPYVSMNGLEDIYDIFQNVSKPVILALLPLVLPEQVPSFENFAKKTFDSKGLPASSGVSDFGFGIFGFDSSGARYHDTTGETDFSPYNFLTPVIDIAHMDSDASALLLNAHSIPSRGIIQDRIFECALLYDNCGAMTDIIQLATATAAEQPCTIAFHPVFPFQNKTKMTGFVVVGFQWSEIMLNAIPGNKGTVDCVLSTGTADVTYEVGEGKAQYRGMTDSHNTDFDNMVREICLTLENSASAMPATYTLKVYPNKAYYDSFHSHSPLYVGLGMVGAILVTSIIFFAYDSYVKKDSLAKAHVLFAKRQFVRFVSHEIRTPLNCVQLSMQLLRTEMNEHVNSTNERKSDLLEVADEVLANTDAAIEILNDLLNYDKIETGVFKLEKKLIPLMPFLQSALSVFYAQAEQRDVLFKINLKELSVPRAGKVLCVHADPLRLTQVVRNLISNALKFTPAQGKIKMSSFFKEETSCVSSNGSRRLRSISPSVSYSDLFSGNRVIPLDISDGNLIEEFPVDEDSDATVIISVKDTGAGISKSNQKQLFEEGVQFNAALLQAGQGSGLGLCIAKNIAELHGGHLWGESEGEGKGSTFYLELPVLWLDEEEMSFSRFGVRLSNSRNVVSDGIREFSGRTSTAETEAPPTDDSVHRLLVVDDAPSNRKVLCRILSRKGFTCEEAVDGVQCIEKMKSKPQGYFKAILMDFQMPLKTGPEATADLRGLGYTLPIVGVTGNVMPDDVDYFLSCGANMVMQKPFDIQFFLKNYPSIAP